MTAAVACRVVETKRMLRAAQEASGVPIKAAHQDMEVSYPYLADALNEAEPQRLPVDLLVPFMRATGSRRPLCWLASQMDCAVVALPTATDGAGDIRDRFMRVVDELGQDSAVIQRALGDGEITPSEGREIVDELRDTIEELLRVEAAVLAKVQKPAPARMGLQSTTPAVTRRLA